MFAGRKHFKAICTLADGRQSDDVSLIWTEGDPNVIRVSSAGTVFGVSVGETQVSAGDDDCFADNTVTVKRHGPDLLAPFIGKTSF